MVVSEFQGHFTSIPSLYGSWSYITIRREIGLSRPTSASTCQSASLFCSWIRSTDLQSSLVASRKPRHQLATSFCSTWTIIIVKYYLGTYCAFRLTRSATYNTRTQIFHAGLDILGDEFRFKFLFSQHKNFPRRSSFSTCHSASCLRNPSFGLAMLLRSLTYSRASVNDMSLLIRCYIFISDLLWHDWS